MLAAKKIKRNSSYETYEDFYKKQHQEKMKKTAMLLEKKKRRYRRQRRVRFLIQSFAVCAVVFGLLSLLVIRYAMIFEINYNVQGLEREIRVLELEKEDLRVQMDSTVVLENVEKVAINDLGMQYPKSEQIVYLNQKWDYKLKSKQALQTEPTEKNTGNTPISNMYMAYIQAFLKEE